MRTIVTNPLQAIEIKRREAVNDYVQYKWEGIKNSLIDFFKYLYIILVFILLIVVVLELKTYFNIDVFPGVDTPFDNIERAFIKEAGDWIYHLDFSA